MSDTETNVPSRPNTTAEITELASAAAALLGCRTADDVYAVACEFMGRLWPNAVVIVNEATPDRQFLVTRALCGIEGSLLARAQKLAKFQIVGKRSAIVPEYRDEMLQGRLSRVTDGLAAFAASEVSPRVASAMGNLLGIHDVFTIGIADGDTALGNIHIFARTPGVSPPAAAVESLARHCYSALAALESAKGLAQSAELNRLVLRNMVEGLALHEIVLDANGVPCDYRFLDVNPAFEAVTGLRAEDILGRTVLEVLPGTERVWIERYGKVALTGVPDRFEQYASRLDRHLSISAYSPAPGQFVSLVSDITDRKRADEALAASEARFRAIYALSPVAMAMNDNAGRITSVNAAMMQLFGYALDEIPTLAEWWPTAYPDPEYRRWISEVWQTEVDRARDTGTPFLPVEAVVTCKDGTTRTVLVGSSPLHAGSDSEHLITFYDITDQQNAEHALRNALWRLDNIIEGARVGTWEWNVQSGVTVYNERWAEIVGYTLAELAPTSTDTWRALVHPDDLTQLDAMLQRHFSGEVAYYDSEYRMRHKDGHWVWVRDRGRVVSRTQESQPLMMFGTHSDITNRKQSEQTLRESEDRFRRLFTSIEQGMALHEIITSEDGTPIDYIYLDVNESYTRLLGVTRDVIGKRIREVMPQVEEYWITNFGEVALTGRPSYYENYLETTGRYYATYAYSPAKNQFAVLVTDISERRFAEDAIKQANAELERRVEQRTEQLTAANRELQSANELLEEATRAKSDFLASMSHELRTPLNSIIGFSDLLGRGMVGELEPEQSKQVGMINASGRHLLSLVDDILDLTKIESGQTQSAYEEFEVCSLVERVLDMVRPLAEEKGIELQLSCSPNAIWLESDPRFVSQILTNLLGNAVKFTDAGHVRLSVALESQSAIFTVTDTGRGISAEDLPHVMERFYQAKPEGAPNTGGTGLGLAISARLAEMIGATLDVSSTVGVGSTFVLRVPLQATPDAG